MATRKITRKVRVVEPDLTNPIYTHEWSVEDNTDYASINDFYLTYNNINYYFTKPNTIEIGDKFYFNIDTKVLKLNEDTISTSTTGSSNNELSFVPSHKWSDEYINIGANAENVFCSDGKTVEEKLSGLGGNYVEKTGDTMTGNLTTPGLTVGSRKNDEIIGTNSVAEGYNVVASGLHSHAEGVLTTASGSDSHTEGGYTTASAYYSHAEGHRSTASDSCSHAEGWFTVANNVGAHAENGNSLQRTVIITGDANATTYTTTNTNNAKVGQYLKYQNEVRKITALEKNTSITVETTFSNKQITNQTAYLMSTTASGQSSHAEGRDTLASGAGSHAEGLNTQATNSGSHAEGANTTASGLQSHAEGEYTTASHGTAPHAEGSHTTATGTASHAEGKYTNITGNYGHGEGQGTKSTNRSQHVQGEYNIHDSSGNNVNRGTYAHIVGNGTADNARSNAHTLDWAGNAWYAGNIYVGSTSGVNKDEGSKKLATEEYVNTNGGKIDSISIDGRAQTIDANKNVDLTGLEKTFNKVTSLSDSSTDDQYPTAKAVYNEITSKISSVYKAKGTCTFANKPALNASNEGFVYNISDAFTTTSDFIEGSGKNYPAGTNIVVINNGTAASPSWKYDILAGMTDLSGYVQKAGDTMTGALTTTALTVGSRKSGSSIGTHSSAEGYINTASGSYSHAEGSNTIASAASSHSEGTYTIASGNYSHAEGQYTETNGSSTHAEGCYTRAKGNYSHSEGNYTLASGAQSHAEGGSGAVSPIILSGEAGATVYTTAATGNIRIGSTIRYNGLLYSVTAVVANTSITLDRTLSSDTALENVSVSFYNSSAAIGTNSHAENVSVARGNYSHSEGLQTIAKNKSQHVEGEYNIEDTSTSSSANRGKYLHIAGNGTSETARSNAYTLDWNGNAWFKGDIYTGGTDQTTGTSIKNTLNSLAPKASPALTGTPTAPTASAGTSSTQIATTAFVGTALNNKIKTQTTDPGVGATLATGNIILVYE